MDATKTFFDFVQQQSGKLLIQTFTHIGLTFISVMLAILIGLPLGILITRKKKMVALVLTLAGILQTIPSIALLGLMIPLLGIGPKPAIVALFLYALLPIIRNTFTGITGVDRNVTEAANGMGMSRQQLLFKVELPLAMPVILAGIRTATVINVGVATLAAYIAGGGLGEFIFGGIALNNTNMMLAGAIPAALLAILFDWLLSLVQHVSVRKIRLACYLLPVILLLLCSCYFIPEAYHNKMLAGFTPEFMGRKDGYQGLTSKYKLNIHNLVISDMIMYKAIYEKKLDVISGSSTDGRVKAFDLALLQDDKHIFPPYYAAPIIRTETLLKYPELEQVLNMLSGTINDSIMTELNYRVDYLKLLPEKVAKDFLITKNLWKPPTSGKKGSIRIGSKIFGDGYILANMYKMLIEGYTSLSAVTKTGLGGTKIVFNALINDQIDMYPEYTGTGLLVIVQAPQHIVDSVIADRNKVFDYVYTTFLKLYQVKWLKPIGFNNTYALMMRRADTSKLHIHNISALSDYVNHR